MQKLDIETIQNKTTNMSNWWYSGVDFVHQGIS